MTVDDRSWMMQMICSLRIEDALLLLYPSVFPVSDIVLEQPNDEARLFLLFFILFLVHSS